LFALKWTKFLSCFSITEKAYEEDEFYGEATLPYCYTNVYVYEYLSLYNYTTYGLRKENELCKSEGHHWGFVPEHDWLVGYNLLDT